VTSTDNINLLRPMALFSFCVYTEKEHTRDRDSDYHRYKTGPVAAVLAGFGVVTVVIRTECCCRGVG